MNSMTERLSYLMKKNSIKAAELAEAISVTPSTISRILNGTQMPTSDTLYKFAQYFHVSMEYLLTGDGDFPENRYLSLTESQQTLLRYYENMSSEDQNELLMIARIKASKKA